MVVATVAAVLAGGGLAQARGVLPTARAVGSATASVTPCGSLGGIGVAWTSTDNVVTSLALSAVPASCAGGVLSVTLAGVGGVALGTAGPLTVSGTSMTLSSVSGAPVATAVRSVHVSVSGP